MAVNQAKIFDQLEALTKELNQDEFIFGFMAAFNFPKATITQVRDAGPRNVAKEPGHIAVKNKLYYQSAASGDDLEGLLEQRRADPATAKNKIRFIMVTDFIRLLAWDTLSKELLDIEIEELFSNYAFFLPLVGLEKAIIGSENPADVKAAEKMGKLFDLIRINNDLTKPEDIHALNVFLTRLLFCLFAEDTGIFQQGQFTKAIKSFTQEDGSDLDYFLDTLFKVLNTPENSPERSRLPAHLNAFPFVNGGLFASDEPIPELGKKGRRILLECASEDWSEINPDIFGSMFQAVIDVEQRSRLGQHYTSYTNIMKVITPLFLEPLRTELEKHRRSAKGLKTLLVRLGKIKVFDPACGSGNFLIIAYKELRKLEMEVLKALNEVEPQVVSMSGMHLSQFYGIEIDDFACEIARLSLWLAEHQLNSQWQQEFGYAPPALPLRESGNICSDNSLRLDWQMVCPKAADDEVYVIGNPPFVDAKARNVMQRQDMDIVFEGQKSVNALDYVGCWFWKGAQYIENSKSQLALISTNSICQGEQVALLWPLVFSIGVDIQFAYQTFSWTNNARSKAAVHVVVIGLSANKHRPVLYQHSDKKWHSSVVSNISPYLVEGKNTAVRATKTPLTSRPLMVKGNETTDDGHLVLDKSEYERFLDEDPNIAKWIRPFLGGVDFLNGGVRWCLWLEGIQEDELKMMPRVRDRVELVKSFRSSSPKAATRARAATPWLFGENRQPSTGSFIVVPKVSSERRDYIPIDFKDFSTVINNTLQFIPNASLFDFAIIQSAMHIAWISGIGGKMKSDYQYSIQLIYNTYPWPEASEAQRQQIELLAEEVLLKREEYPGRSLAELYDPDKMPEQLLAAHQALDLAVDRLYRPRPFKDTADRLSCLLERYEMLVAQQHKNSLKEVS